MAKREKINATTVEPEAGEERTAMFGWCSTGHHDGCVVTIPRYRCSCKCHETKDKDLG